MLHVFSGCGMSRKVADMIGDVPGTTGFVMPVYGWRLPREVRRRVRELKAVDGPCWAVFTCGDCAGNIDRDLEKELGRKFGNGFRLDAAFSVLMPDTYLGLPGFRLDSREETARKLAEAQTRCRQIRARLEKLGKDSEPIRDLRRGPLPWVLTNLIGRFFDRFLVTDRFWKVDAARCLKCGRCAEECPTGDIALVDGVPRWQHSGACTGCFRCYHVCRGDAIEFGPFTRGKGRLGLSDECMTKE